MRPSKPVRRSKAYLPHARAVLFLEQSSEFQWVLLERLRQEQPVFATKVFQCMIILRCARIRTPAAASPIHGVLRLLNWLTLGIVPLLARSWGYQDWRKRLRMG